jgi:hypothetical protein
MSEKREFFRVRDRLEIEFREIRKEEFLKLEHEIKYRPSHQYHPDSRMNLTEDLWNREDNKDLLIPYLRLIDRKLSTIMDLLAPTSCDLQNDKVFPSTAWYGEVDISGAGLSFVQETPIDEGALLFVRLMLPIFPYPAIRTLCEAVRKREVSTEGAKGWKTALKFQVINDLDRDLLISYIFDKEREQIRLHKDHRNG